MVGRPCQITLTTETWALAGISEQVKCGRDGTFPGHRHKAPRLHALGLPSEFSLRIWHRRFDPTLSHGGILDAVILLALDSRSEHALCSRDLDRCIHVGVPDFGPRAEIGNARRNSYQPCMPQQYEAGRKNHMGWHKNQNDTWSWYTWAVVTGEAPGSHIIETFGHNWKDPDGRQKLTELTAPMPRPAGDLLWPVNSKCTYVYRPDLSLSQEVASPAPLVSVTHFILKPDGMNDFLEESRRSKKVSRTRIIQRPAPAVWYQLVNGGESPHFVLVGGCANWAGFQPPTEKLWIP